MEKTFRNLYFPKDLPRFTGSSVVYYTGRIIRNAGHMERYANDFDRSKDHYFGCDCDGSKIRALIKVKK